MEKIKRNEDEQAAFMQLLAAVECTVPFHVHGSMKTQVTAEDLERELLARGYAITKIPPVNLHVNEYEEDPDLEVDYRCNCCELINK